MRPIHILGALALAAATACSSQARETAAPPAAVPVTVGTVVTRAVPSQVQVIGTVEALSTVEIKSQVGGELTALSFEEGQEVRRGQTLFTIDPRPYQAALAQAEGALARDQVRLANAREVVKRYTDLVKKEFVTKEEYDKISADADALDATVRADAAAVENARLELGYCTIRSPIDGRTGRLMVHRGNVVKSNADTPMITINQVDPIRVAFSVPEKALPEVKRRMAAGKLQAEAATSDGSKAAGELSFVDNAVDAGTGTILLKATFQNKDRLLWPGQFVEVSLTLATDPDALLVPTPAVQTGQQGTFLFVVKPDMTVEARPIVVSRAVGSESVIEKGVSQGETVVTDGQLRLVPGARIEIKGSAGDAGTGKP